VKKIAIYLQKYRTPKLALSKIIGIGESSFHYYLNPSKYADRNLSDATLEKIASFEGVSVASIRKEYEARKAAA